MVNKREKQYSRKELIDELYRFIDTYDRNPYPYDMCKKNGFISIHNYYKIFGSWKAALNEANIYVKPGYTKKELIDYLYKFVNENGRVPRKRDMGSPYPSEAVYYRVFGGWNNALEAAGLEINVDPYKEYSDEELVNSVYKFIEENGKIPRLNDMLEKDGYIPCNRYITRYVSWENALKTIGVVGNKKHYSKEDLIKYLQDFMLEYNKSPTVIDIKQNDEFPSSTTFIMKFGSWNKALAAAGLPIMHLYRKHDSDECCSICGSNITEHWRYDNEKVVCDKCKQSERKFFNGILDPNCSTGMGVITEYVVSKVLADCDKCNTTETFNAPYDLVSKKYGTIDVKSVKLVLGRRNHNYWKFDRSRNRTIPDYYICLAFNINRVKIEHVWIIPSDSKIIAKTSITIAYGNIQRASQYEVDATPYNEVYQNLDIYSLPEFCNLPRDDTTKSTSPTENKSFPTTAPQQNHMRYIDEIY